MSKVRSFISLPGNLQELAIKLAITRAGQDEHSNLSIIVESAVAAAGAAMDVGIKAVKVEPVTAKSPVASATDALQAKAESLDSAVAAVGNGQNDLADALSYLFSSMQTPAAETHCGNPNCDGCNEAFGELKASEPTAKPRWKPLTELTKDGLSIFVNQSVDDPKKFALYGAGKALVIEGQTEEFTLTTEIAFLLLNQFGK